MWMQFPNIAQTRRAFDRAPHVPITGTSTLRIDQLFPDDIIAPHVMGVFPEFSVVTPLRSDNAQGAWGAFPGLRVGLFGPTKCIRMDEWGE